MVVAANEAGEHARTLLVTHTAIETGSGSNALEEIRAAAADGAVLGGYTTEQLRTRAVSTEVMSGLGQASSTTDSVERVAHTSDTHPDTDDLLCEYVSSEKFNAILGLRIRPGERVTGWVAANRQTISNSDATLDLGQASLWSTLDRAAQLALRLSGSQGDFHGVLTAYSPVADVFTHRHVYAFEQLANTLGEHLSKIRPQGQ